MNKPNIILIVSDQHRGDFMGHRGNRTVNTPNLDRLAAGGVSFIQHYCNSPLCVPSRMSMLAGRHPHHTGVFGNEDCLASDMPTFAHSLALGGYQTVLCGRMHFVGADQRHGFHRRLVGDITPSYTGGPKTDYGHLAGTSDSDMISITLAGQGNNPVMRYDEAVTSACEQFLEQSGDRTDGKPFLLTVGLYGPHNPYTCSPEEYARALAAMEQYNNIIPQQPNLHPWIESARQKAGLGAMTKEQLKMARAHYIGLVNHLDGYIGRIVKAAESLRRDTLLIYISDHGDMAGDHGLFWKRSFYEGAAKVPMIWYPVVQQNGNLLGSPGRSVDVPTSLVDLAPTLAAVTHSPELPHPDGHDLSVLLREPGGSDSDDMPSWKDRAVYSELVIPGRTPARMIRTENYKLVYYHGYSALQLFDLDKDPHEVNDVSESSDYAGVKQRLLSRLTEHWDGEELLRRRDRKRPDHEYMKKWGQTVGMGKLDLWDYERHMSGSAT
ncbi:sulfatase-like hydrolase/transferase [Paenibacillus thalictri]|nr:sulfatase-like hydrolase/transferase [Paenibacillus thalictri]